MNGAGLTADARMIARGTRPPRSRRRGAACVWLGLLSLGSLAASATWARAETCEAAAVRQDAAIHVEDLGAWEPVDELTVLVWPPGGTRAYLLRLARPVRGLAEVEMVSLDDGDHDGLITPCGHDAVIQDDAVAEIVAIEHLSEERTVALDRRGWTEL